MEITSGTISNTSFGMVVTVSPDEHHGINPVQFILLEKGKAIQESLIVEDVGSHEYKVAIIQASSDLVFYAFIRDGLQMLFVRKTGFSRSFASLELESVSDTIINAIENI